jgi:hypothetical protein
MGLPLNIIVDESKAERLQRSVVNQAERVYYRNTILGRLNILFGETKSYSISIKKPTITL